MIAQIHTIPRRALQRFYPWAVIGIAFLTVAMAFGACNALAVFLIAVIEEFHWSRGLASGALMLGSAVWTASAPIIGAAAGTGPWLGGVIFDITSSYRVAIWIAQAVTFSSVVIIWLAGSRHHRQKFCGIQHLARVSALSFGMELSASDHFDFSLGCGSYFLVNPPKL